MKYFTTGKLAKAAGVNIETIRFYERLGLLPIPKRKPSLWGHGYRQYEQDALKQLLFIKKAKALGFSLKEIQELLSLKIENPLNCEEVRNRALAKLKEVKEKIKLLENIKRTLENLINDCQKREITEQCPILSSLDGEIKILEERNE